MAVVTVHAVVFVGRWAVSHWVVKWSAQTLMLFFVVEFGRRRDSRFAGGQQKWKLKDAE
jgi:hypothetical protein